jgi:Spy/CpxP family protein refolding chaperone
MNMKKLIVGLIVAAVFLGGGLTLAFTQVQAQNTNTPTATDNQLATPNSPASQPGTTTALALTDTQKQQLQDLAQKQQDSAKALQDQSMTAVQQLKDALVANPTDQAKLSQAQSQILSFQDQLAKAQTDFALQVKGIVGPDQFGNLGRFGSLGGVEGMPGPGGRGDRMDGQMNERMNQMEDRISQLEQRLGQLDGKTPTTPAMLQGRLDDGTRTATTPPDERIPDLSNWKDQLGLTGLSDAQLTQLNDLRTSTASSVKGLRDQMQTAEKDLQAAILANPTDQAKLDQDQSTISSLRSQILQAEINAALKAKEILGADNFAKVVDMFTNFGPGFGKGSGFGMDFGLGFGMGMKNGPIGRGFGPGEPPF